jgi:hypothetical protein
VDDIALGAGTWQTIGVITATVGTQSARALPITDRLTGTYTYRVKAVYGDGSATVWSAPQQIDVERSPTAIGAGAATAQGSAGSVVVLVLPLVVGVGLLWVYGRFRPKRRSTASRTD